MSASWDADQLFDRRVVAELETPWSMAFLPDGRLIVTERPPNGETATNPDEGQIRIVTQAGVVSAPLSGLPDNVGILDVKLDPDFAQNHYVYFSFIESDPSAPRVGRNADDLGVNPAGIAVARAVLDADDPTGPTLESMSVIWRQYPKVVSFAGSGEPGGRLAFSPDGTYLYIAAGDRQEFEPVQSLDNTLGKIIRIFPDGTIPSDNPFVGVEGAKPEIWSLGHRNPYGLLFDANGVLWENEMGPKGGDELNAIHRGDNYGWPNVSYGKYYDDSPIPKPAAGDGYEGASLTWTPVIAPSSMITYSGTALPDWEGHLIISGLQSRGLVVVDTTGTSAAEVARIDLGGRVRDVLEAPDGSLWVLYDQPDGRLVHLAPAPAGVTAVGDASNNALSGGAGDDWLQGLGGNDTLTGSSRDDLLDGGDDVDVAVIASTLSSSTVTVLANGDVVVTSADGTDTLRDIETIRFSGGDVSISNYVLYGTTITDTLVGSAGGQVLFGFLGDDTLDGGAGADQMYGGLGNDTFLVDNAADQVIEMPGNGTDTIITSVAYTAPSNVERLVLASSGAGTLTANATGTTLIGNSQVNQLIGKGGDDVLTGGAGADMLTGGAGKDVFRDTLAGLNGDTIADFVSGDRIVFTDATIATFTFSLSGNTLTYSGGSLTLSSFSSATSLVASAAAGGGVQLTVSRAQNDFNHDGRSDILWRSTGGMLSDWLGQSNGGFAKNDANAMTSVPTSWKVAGTGDFNGDGRADILWRNDNGQLSDWLGQANGGFVGNDANAMTSVPTSWKVAGTGDFNGDGRADILWRNDNGQLSDWLGHANGGFVGNDANAMTSVPTSWKVAGTGDFNGDGRTDILWRNDNGQLSNWLGQANGGFVGNDANAMTSAPTSWKVAGTGDFNGDGRADILWRNDNGQLSNWLGQANGGFVGNDANAMTSVVTSWRVAATGDYDGDGRDDILWRNDNGQLSNWLGQAGGGFAANDINALASVTTDWQPQKVPDFLI